MADGTKEDDNTKITSPGRKTNSSIFKSPSDVCSINSAVTMDTRMYTLETTLNQILVFMKTTQAKPTNADNDQASEATTQDVTTVTTPTSPEGGVGG